MSDGREPLLKLYLGGLPLDADEAELGALLVPFGAAVDLALIRDGQTGRSRGFGFVKLPRTSALAAVDALDGTELRGHRLRVNEARDRGAPAPRRRY